MWSEIFISASDTIASRTDAFRIAMREEDRAAAA